MSMSFESGKLRYSLTGNCLTVFSKSGRALWRRFFDTINEARIIFMELMDD